LLISLIKEGAVILIIIFIIFFNIENCQTAVTVTGVSLRSDIIFDFICCDILMFRFFFETAVSGLFSCCYCLLCVIALYFVTCQCIWTVIFILFFIS